MEANAWAKMRGDLRLEITMSVFSDEPVREDPVAMKLTEKAMERLGRFAMMFYRKQLDYGVGNIGKFGKLGVLVRLNDKVERLNTMWKEGQTPSHESVEDTFYDIIGYAVIGLLLQEGVWPEGGCA